MHTREETIKEWVGVYTAALYEWAFYRLGDKEQAKDLVQDTFIAAFEKFESYEGRSNPRTWLMSVLNHKILDHYRKQYRTPVSAMREHEPLFFDEAGMWLDDKRPQHWDTDTHLLDSPDFVKVLDDCLSKLPGLWASVIRLKYLSEKDGGEVCRDLNISAANFWQIIHRAKLNMRQCLDINWFKH